jgi:hypothetical protein
MTYQADWKRVENPHTLPVGTLVRYRNNNDVAPEWQHMYTALDADVRHGFATAPNKLAHLYLAVWAYDFEAVVITDRGTE